MNSVSPVPLDQLIEAKKSAQKDALFAALTAGLVSSILGSRIMGFNRSQTLFTGLATGSLSGYFFTQAFLPSRIAQAEEQQRMLEHLKTRQPSANDNPT